MKTFPPHPLQPLLSEDFRLTISCGDTELHIQGTMRFEYEVDAAITTLLAVRHLLRDNAKPLPRSKSLKLVS